MNEDGLLARLRDRGWRLTPQRRAVVSVLGQEPTHKTAAEVHGAARRLTPDISLATVYNVLADLAATGEVVELRTGGGATLFDATLTPHHHLVCDDCGSIVDVPSVDTGCLRLGDVEAQGLVVRRVELVLHGSCGCSD